MRYMSVWEEWDDGSDLDPEYNDIENYILQWTPAGTSIELMRPHFPSWRRRLRESGVEKVSVNDAVASNLMVHFIREAAPRSVQDRHAMHEHRNLLWAQGVPMFRGRGWKI